MKTMPKRLTPSNIQALIDLSTAEGFPYQLTDDLAAIYCGDKAPDAEGVRTYGVFADDRLVSVMTATFCTVFPCNDAPSGRIVHISGVFTLPAYRNRRCASDLLRAVEADATVFGADYLCCDSTADGFYLRCGFSPAPADETRMWKRTPVHKEDQL